MSPFNSPFFIEIQQHQAANFPAPNATSQLYEMIVVRTGTLVITAYGREFRLVDGAIFLCGPGQHHNISTDPNIHGYLLLFPMDIFCEPAAASPSGLAIVRELVAGPVVLTLDEETHQDMKLLLRLIVREFHEGSFLRMEMLRLLCRWCLLRIGGRLVIQQGQIRPSHQEEVTGRFLEMLSKQMREKKMVIEYAQELSLTASYLNYTVKKVTGYTASYHIQQQIVREAKRLAVMGGMSMKQVAYELGFEDQSHFSKFFKNNAGACYSQFVKELSDKSYI